MSKHRLTISAAQTALELAGGIKTVAARHLGVGRSTLYRFIDRHPSLQDFVAELDETVGDIAEEQLLSLIKRGDPGSVRFYLERKARHRGYAHRVENVGKGGGPIQVQKVNLSGYTLEELEAMEAIMLAAERRNGIDIDAMRSHGCHHPSRPDCDCGTCQQPPANRKELPR